MKLVTLGAALFALALITPDSAEAQGRGRGGGDRDAQPATPSMMAEILISTRDREHIRAFYAAHPQQGVEALPPGIRRNLERGKPLPPGIAKKMPPSDLVSGLSLREGYQIVEVGLDVFLVEVATNVIHDVLMDVVR